MALIVTLTPREIWHAVTEGINRRMESLMDGRPGRFTIDAVTAWGNDIEAAGAELAVAKGLQLHWSAISGEKTPDVFGFEVRWALLDSHCLILSESVSDNDRYIFVTRHIPTFAIHGWIPAKDAKRQRFIKPSKAPGIWYWIPIAELQPIEDLVIEAPMF